VPRLSTPANPSAQISRMPSVEIVFTSGGTEGDNLAISGLARSGDHIITSTIEHHAVLNTCKHLESSGVEVTYVPVDGRSVTDPDDVRRALRPNTRLITIMMANNETGVLQPVEENRQNRSRSRCLLPHRCRPGSRKGRHRCIPHCL